MHDGSLKDLKQVLDSTWKAAIPIPTRQGNSFSGFSDPARAQGPLEVLELADWRTADIGEACARAADLVSQLSTPSANKE